MNEQLIEYPVTCPSCWEQHIVLIDPEDESQSLIEDCHVCCNPMKIVYTIDDEQILNTQVEPA